MTKLQETLAQLTAGELEKFLAQLRRIKEDDTRAAATPSSIPASFSQEDIFVSDRVARDRSVNNIPLAFKVTGELDLSKLQRCLQMIVDRHDSLRSAFVVHNDAVMQKVSPHACIRLNAIEAGERDLERMALEEIKRPFDLETPPMLRALAIRRGTLCTLLIFTFHHIVCDGWSISAFLRELGSLYADSSSNKPTSLTAHYRSYFTNWERERKPANLAKNVNYWREHLTGAAARISLRWWNDVGEPSEHAAQCRFTLSAELTRKLIALASQAKVTLFMLVLGILEVLFYAFCDEASFLILAPIADRSLPGAEQLIGCFLNRVALRADIREQETFYELLSRCQSTVLGAFSHSAVPLQRTLECASQPAPGRKAFEPVLSFRNEPRSRMGFAPLTLEPIPLDGETSRGDFVVNVQLVGKQLDFLIEYRTYLFDRASVTAMVQALHRLFELVVENPDARLANLSRGVSETIAGAEPTRCEIAAVAASLLQNRLRQQARGRS